MSHEKYREWLRLAVANEITGDDMRLLRTHLAECDACREEFQGLRQMMTTLTSRGVVEPSEDMLWEARRNLQAALAKETPVSSISTRATQSVAPQTSYDSPRTRWLSGWFTGFRAPLAGMATAVFGFFIGYLTFGGTQAPVPISDPTQNMDTLYESRHVDQELGGPEIANVKFISHDAKGGEVEVQYDLVRPIRLRAGVDDERVQRVLAYALTNGDNVGTRLRAIDALDTQGKRVHDDDVKMALIRALRTDPNAGVRKHALHVLGDLPFDRDIKDACLYVLASDDNEGLRLGAIDLLTTASKEGHVASKEIYDFLSTQLESRDDALLRARSQALIEEVKDE